MKIGILSVERKVRILHGMNSPNTNMVRILHGMNSPNEKTGVKRRVWKIQQKKRI